VDGRDEGCDADCQHEKARNASWVLPLSPRAITHSRRRSGAFNHQSLPGTVTAMIIEINCRTTPAANNDAAEVVGIHVGGAGLGFTVGNGHYYDRHHRQSYT
jgi:hypothetical protein